VQQLNLVIDGGRCRESWIEMKLKIAQRKTSTLQDETIQDQDKQSSALCWMKPRAHYCDERCPDKKSKARIIIDLHLPAYVLYIMFPHSASKRELQKHTARDP
jgi:hypothetical protein